MVLMAKHLPATCLTIFSLLLEENLYPDSIYCPDTLILGVVDSFPKSWTLSFDVD